MIIRYIDLLSRIDDALGNSGIGVILSEFDKSLCINFLLYENYLDLYCRQIFIVRRELPIFEINIVLAISSQRDYGMNKKIERTFASFKLESFLFIFDRLQHRSLLIFQRRNGVASALFQGEL